MLSMPDKKGLQWWYIKGGGWEKEREREREREREGERES